MLQAPVGCTPVWALLWMWPWPHEELPLQGDFFFVHMLFESLGTAESHCLWTLLFGILVVYEWLWLVKMRSHGSPVGFSYCAMIVWMTVSLVNLCSALTLKHRRGFKIHCAMQEQYLMVFKFYSDDLQMACIFIWNSFHIFVLYTWNLEC